MTVKINDELWNTIVHCVDVLEQRRQISSRNFLDDNDYFSALVILVRDINANRT